MIRRSRTSFSCCAMFTLNIRRVKAARRLEFPVDMTIAGGRLTNAVTMNPRLSYVGVVYQVAAEAISAIEQPGRTRRWSHRRTRLIPRRSRAITVRKTCTGEPDHTDPRMTVGHSGPRASHSALPALSPCRPCPTAAPRARRAPVLRACGRASCDRFAE